MMMNGFEAVGGSGAVGRICVGKHGLVDGETVQLVTRQRGCGVDANKAQCYDDDNRLMQQAHRVKSEFSLPALIYFNRSTFTIINYLKIL